jgi:hypothetical protein
LSKSYKISGIVLIVIGAIMAASYYPLDLVTLAGFGLTVMVLGLTCVGLVKTIPSMSTQARSTLPKLIISMLVALYITDGALVLFKHNDITLYFGTNTIVYLTIAWIYLRINPKADSAVKIVGAFLICGFALSIVLKMLEILK